MMMIARLMKMSSLKRQSIKKSAQQDISHDGAEEGEENEKFIEPPPQLTSALTTTEAHSAPSRSGRTIRFSLETDERHHSNQNSLTVFQKMAKRPSIPDTWWVSYYLQRKSDLPPPRIVLRSDKHDYRNPDSNYSDDIVDSLRQKLVEETEELDLQHRLNPFLSKDFLKTLQQFGLFPEPEDEEEEGDDDEEIVEEAEGGADEEDVKEEDEEGLRMRTRSDASHLRSRTASMRSSSNEDLKSKTKDSLQVVVDPAAARGSSMEDNVNRTNISPRPSNAAQHLMQSRRKLFQKRVRRWTITSVSLRSLHRITKRTQVMSIHPVNYLLLL